MLDFDSAIRLLRKQALESGNRGKNIWDEAADFLVLQKGDLNTRLQKGTDLFVDQTPEEAALILETWLTAKEFSRFISVAAQMVRA